MAKDDENEVGVYAGDPKSPANYKKFPAKPSVWDQVKEAFEPTATRAMLDSIRKRRDGAS